LVSDASFVRLSCFNVVVPRDSAARSSSKVPKLRACWDREVTHDPASRSAQHQRWDTAHTCFARQVGFSADVVNRQRDLIRQRGHVLQQSARLVAQLALWPARQDDGGLRLDEEVERYRPFQLLDEMSSKGLGFGFWNESHDSTP
jgi:hypothetical protein